MNELQQKIVGIVDANNGTVAWENLVDGLEFPERQRALSEVRALEKQGVLRRDVYIDKETRQRVFNVVKVGA